MSIREAPFAWIVMRYGVVQLTQPFAFTLVLCVQVPRTIRTDSHLSPGPPWTTPPTEWLSTAQVPSRLRRTSSALVGFLCFGRGAGANPSADTASNNTKRRMARPPVVGSRKRHDTALRPRHRVTTAQRPVCHGR